VVAEICRGKSLAAQARVLARSNETPDDAPGRFLESFPEKPSFINPAFLD